MVKFDWHDLQLAQGPWPHKILSIIEDHPDCTSREVWERLESGATKAYVHTVLRTFASVGLLRERVAIRLRDGTWTPTRWILSEEAGRALDEAELWGYEVDLRNWK